MVKFENGTLIKGAYVEINGAEHNVHMPEIEGDTPASAENLNKLQEDLCGFSNKLEILQDTDKGATVVIPQKYEVGTNVLEVYLNGIKLIKATDIDTEGHYYELGESGAISNQIKLTNDWNLETGDILEFVTKGEYNDDTE